MLRLSRWFSFLLFCRSFVFHSKWQQQWNQHNTLVSWILLKYLFLLSVVCASRRCCVFGTHMQCANKYNYVQIIHNNGKNLGTKLECRLNAFKIQRFNLLWLVYMLNLSIYHHQFQWVLYNKIVWYRWTQPVLSHDWSLWLLICSALVLYYTFDETLNSLRTFESKTHKIWMKIDLKTLW